MGVAEFTLRFVCWAVAVALSAVLGALAVSWMPPWLANPVFGLAVMATALGAGRRIFRSIL